LDDSSASDRSDATLSDLPEPEATPAFLGSQATTTRRRALQSVLYGLVGALALMLAAQAAHHFRDLIAARWPAARPALLAWCATVRCVVAPPQRIDEVSVESTALTRSSTADAFNLSVALRNRGELTLAVPSVDLSLTDPTGQLVARRVLTPRDFRMTSATMPPLAETNLRATLTAGESRVTGYTVEVFYP
jgi:hypothetical protein